LNERQKSLRVRGVRVEHGRQRGYVLAANATSAVLAAPARADSAADARARLLYERYHDRVYGFCFYKLGNREEAEDAAQTTFMYVVSSLRRGIVPRAEANWVFTIALNACRARNRARGRRRACELPQDPQTLQELSPARTPEHEELAGLEDALAGLPDLQRRAILLREWRGLSYREIAEKLELSGAAVETLIFRARRSLAERLEQPAARETRSLFGLGSLAATLKSALGVGSALKLAAGAAAVATLVVGVPSDSARQPTQGPSRSGALPVDTQARLAPARGNERGLVPGEAPATRSRDATPAVGAPDVVQPLPDDATAATLVETVEETSESLPLVGDVVEAAPLDVVGGVEAAVGGLVETADSALDLSLP
jgi:RNA polymerase sigma-70 factor (ECF subfamily)